MTERNAIVPMRNLAAATEMSGLKNNPIHVARQLAETIHRIERTIDKSDENIREIEERGILQGMFKSVRGDFVSISKSQAEINKLMIDVINHVVMLNMMNFSFLTTLIHEFNVMVENGWYDQEGRLQKLSDTGKQFAETTNELFTTILHNVKTKNDTMRVQQEQLEELHQNYEALKSRMNMLQQRNTKWHYILTGCVCVSVIFMIVFFMG